MCFTMCSYQLLSFSDAVFGSKLHELCDREKDNVPKFVRRCIAAIEKKGKKNFMQPFMVKFVVRKLVYVLNTFVFFTNPK